MVLLNISPKQTKCKKCSYLSYKIVYKEGPDPERFGLLNNQLMCSHCGHTFYEKLQPDKRIQQEISSKEYEEMLKRHKEYQSKKE